METRRTAADRAAASGLDPQEYLAQIESKLQFEKEKSVQRLVSRLKFEDKVKEREFIMKEEQRSLQQQYSLALQPSEAELTSQLEAEKWSRIAGAGLQFAGAIGEKLEERDYAKRVRAAQPTETTAGPRRGEYLAEPAYGMPYGDIGVDFLERYYGEKRRRIAGGVNIFENY
jgi:hypothetical protein